jgi:hypothetical protein
MLAWISNLGTAGGRVVVPSPRTDAFSGGWERHPYLRPPAKRRYELPVEAEQIIARVVAAAPMAAAPNYDSVVASLEASVRAALLRANLAYSAAATIALREAVARRIAFNRALAVLVLLS